MSFRFSIPGIIFFVLLAAFCSCSKSGMYQENLQLTEKIFHSADSLARYKSGAAAKAHVDSAFARFPFVSVKDRVSYYMFLMRLIEMKDGGNFDADSLLALADSSLKLIDRNSLTKEMAVEYAECMRQKGVSLLFLNKINEAYHFLLLSRNISREKGDSCNCGEISNYLGSAQYRKQKYAGAAAFYKEALKLSGYCSKEWKKYYNIQYSLNNTGLCYLNTGQPDSAAIYFNRAAEYIISKGPPFADDKSVISAEALSSVYENLFNLFIGKKNFNRAEEYILKCDSINKRILQSQLWTVRIRLCKARLSLEKGEVKKAYRLAVNPSFAEVEYDPDYHLARLKLLADICHGAGNIKQELLCRRQFHLYKDSLEKKRKRLPDMEREFEQVERKYQLNLLAKENRRQENLRQATLIVAALLILLISVVFIREFQLRKLLFEKEKIKVRELKEELLLQDIQLRNQQNEAIRRQRKKISSDLHDDLSGSLAALKYFVGDIRNKARDLYTKQMFLEIEKEIGVLYEGARQYMHSLQDDTGDNQQDTVSLLNEINRKFAEKELFRMYKDIEVKRIKSELGIHRQKKFYQIVREAIANMMK
jgi:tetratricopeptide (TPR) repeat protein